MPPVRKRPATATSEAAALEEASEMPPKCPQKRAKGSGSQGRRAVEASQEPPAGNPERADEGCDDAAAGVSADDKTQERYYDPYHEPVLDGQGRLDRSRLQKEIEVDPFAFTMHIYDRVTFRRVHAGDGRWLFVQKKAHTWKCQSWALLHSDPDQATKRQYWKNYMDLPYYLDPCSQRQAVIKVSENDFTYLPFCV